MATETLVPDGVISSSGLSHATVAYLNADDGNWATATSGNVDGSVQVSFPTPSGTLNGTQTFNAKVRADASNTPTARLELWEHGGSSALAVGSNISVTSTTSQTISLSWDASLLADMSGANVEARVVFTHVVGLTPASVDIGYISWTDNYTAATGGSASLTLTDATLAATAALLITASLSATLDPVGLSANGLRPTDHSASLSATLAPTTLSSTAQLLNTGQVNATLDSTALSSNATISIEVFDPAVDGTFSAIQWTYGRADNVGQKAYTGSRNIVTNPWSGKWTAHLEYPSIQGEDKARVIRSFIAQRRGRLIAFRLPATTAPQNSNHGVTVASTAQAGATSMTISGASTALSDGQFVTMNGQLLCLTANQSGSTINFQPPLRESATSGTTVVTKRPYARMFLADSSASWTVGQYRLFMFTLDVEEAVLDDDGTPPEA